MDVNLRIRVATLADLPAIVALLADDAIGATREVVAEPVERAYRDAFAAIEADANHDVIVAVRDDVLVGCLQLSFLPGLARRGAWRGQIEGVRVASSARGAGVGRAIITDAIERCRSRGCGLVQLTSDKARADALRFYASLGFIASHEGMKRSLD